jgi:hypothetical protein
LKNGKVLSIEGPEDVALFSLKGSGKALEILQKCVDAGTGKIKMPAAAAAPMAAGAAPAEAMGSKAASGKPAKFPPSLLKLLKDSGLKNLQLVSIPDPSKAPVDFAWRTNGALGGLREREVPPDITLEKMSGIIEDGYKKQCTGKFGSSLSTPENLPGVQLRTADFSCEIGDKKVDVALLLYVTDTHLFSMFMHEADGAHKSAATSARDAIAASIRKLAREQKPKGAAATAVPAPPATPPAPMAAPQPQAASPWSDPNKAAPQPLPTTPPPAAAPTAAPPPPAASPAAATPPAAH